MPNVAGYKKRTHKAFANRGKVAPKCGALGPATLSDKDELVDCNACRRVIARQIERARRRQHGKGFTGWDWT